MFEWVKTDVAIPAERAEGITEAAQTEIAAQTTGIYSAGTSPGTAQLVQLEETVRAMIRPVMEPIMQSIGEMLQRNTQAMEQIAAAQQLTSERIAALEKRVRLQTPMNAAQVRYLNDEIRRKAREILSGKGCGDDTKAVNKLAAAIRKSVLVRYGISNLREAPAYDYETALKQIAGYNDMLTIRDVVREARARIADIYKHQQEVHDGQDS